MSLYGNNDIWTSILEKEIVSAFTFEFFNVVCRHDAVVRTLSGFYVSELTLKKSFKAKEKRNTYI